MDRAPRHVPPAARWVLLTVAGWGAGLVYLVTPADSALDPSEPVGVSG